MATTDSNSIDRLSQWLEVAGQLAGTPYAEAARQLLEMVSKLQVDAMRAADVAADCRRLERELRQSEMSASLCKQLWRRLVEQSELEQLRQADITAEDSSTKGKGPFVQSVQLRGQLRDAVADLDEAVATSAEIIESLTEPTQREQEHPVLPASVVELPPTLLGQIARRVAVLEQAACRLRWLYDRLLQESLRAVMTQLLGDRDDDRAN